MNKRLLVASLIAFPAAFGALSCSQVKNQVVKDIPIEGQLAISEQYNGRSAWTRIVLEDIGEGGSIPRDTKVRVVDVDMHFNGAVTVETLKKRNRVVYALEIERPLSSEKIKSKLDEIFWFIDPVLRQVAYIRKWGKKAARAIRNHEVFVGMTYEAAAESWGIPTKKNLNEIGGKKNEQWVYPVGKRNKYIYIIDGKVSKWED